VPLLSRQRRIVPVGEVRVIEATKAGLPHIIGARVLTYNVLDEYNTGFDPGVFVKSMAERMPRIVWAHDWSDPLGRWTEYDKGNKTALDLTGEFDSFDDVPQARRAASQLLSGTIDQFSVGFMTEAEQTWDKFDDAWLITEGTLDEVSLVLRGAVPGTKPLFMRSKRNGQRFVVDADYAKQLIMQYSLGEIEVEDVLTQLKAAATVDAEGTVRIEQPAAQTEPDPEPVEGDPATEGEDEPGSGDEGEPEPAGEQVDAVVMEDLVAALSMVEGMTPA
jgi:HK97 family phage prohead protease